MCSRHSWVRQALVHIDTRHTRRRHANSLLQGGSPRVALHAAALSTEIRREAGVHAADPIGESWKRIAQACTLLLVRTRRLRATTVLLLIAKWAFVLVAEQG